MTKERRLIERFEIALAKFVHNDRLEQAYILEPVVEALEDGEYSEAVRLAIKNKLPTIMIMEIIETFGVEDVEFCPESYQQELSKTTGISSI